MAISKLHALLALSGTAAVGVPAATILMLNSQKEEPVMDNANSETESQVPSAGDAGTTPSDQTTQTQPATPDSPEATKTTTTTTCTAPTSRFGSSLYKNITSRESETSKKLEKWKDFMKNQNKDCKGNSLNESQ